MFTRLILRKPFQVGRAAMSQVLRLGDYRSDGWIPHNCAELHDSRQRPKLQSSNSQARPDVRTIGRNADFRHRCVGRRAVAQLVPADVPLGVGCLALEVDDDVSRGCPPGATIPPTVRPMLATLAEPPLTGKGAGLRAEVRRHPRAGRTSRRARRGPTSGSGRGSATTRPRSSPPSSGRSSRSRAGSRRRCSSTARSSRSTRRGRPAGFQRLQGRIHVKGVARRRARSTAPSRPRSSPSTSCATAHEDLRGLPLTARRARLERHLAGCRPDTLRLSEQVAGDGRRSTSARAREGWEGLIARRRASPYQSGRRSPAWRKLQAAQRAGVRRRRLDRAAPDAAALRRAAARRLRRRQPDGR